MTHVLRASWPQSRRPSKAGVSRGGVLAEGRSSGFVFRRFSLTTVTSFALLSGVPEVLVSGATHRSFGGQQCPLCENSEENQLVEQFSGVHLGENTSRDGSWIALLWA